MSKCQTSDDMHFANSDKVEKDKWILAWRINESNKLYESEIDWMYIHEVFDNGVINEGYEYPKCAIQRRDLGVPLKPFELTPDVVAAFKKVIQQKDVEEYIIQGRRDIFSLEHSLKGFLTLISRMKEHLFVQR